ncbi:MAG: DUF2958 domain-containing protein [Pseudomonadota bacterium]
MKLILDTHRAQMIANFADETRDHAPVVKLFCPWGAATWLLYAMPEDDPGLVLGLCDLGLGFPELGYASLDEIASLRGPGGLRIERDLHFTAAASIEVYAEAARGAERIVEDRASLEAAFALLEARAKREKRTLKAFMVEG